MERQLRFQTTIHLNAPPERLWPLFAQTDRINRTVGLPAVRFSPRPLEAGSTVLRAEARLLGLKLVWDEYPFEWVENRYYHVTRKFLNGPLDELQTGVRLTPEAGHTRLEIFADIIPRNLLGKLVARHIIGRKNLRDMERLAQRFDHYLADGLGKPFAPAGGMGTANTERLETRLRELESDWDGPPDLVRRLREHLIEGHDDEVVGMRPFELADRWEADRLEVLRLCLYATRNGLLDLNWSVLCPTCRVVKARHGTLRDLKNALHCDTCQISYDSDFDQNVELKFNVNQQIRPAEETTYCVGGPGNTPHRLAQFYLGPGEQREAGVHLSSGRFRLRSYEVSPPAELRVRASASEHELRFRCCADGFQPAETVVAEGEDHIRLENATDQFVLAVLEPEEWREKGATAALVTSLQEFRDLFSSEVLAPGEEVSVRSLTFLFTDLKNSTPLYERIGDPPAYGLVRRHFDFLRERIARHHGAIVKTIGDAVMAVFLSGPDAVACALDVQREVAAFNESAPDPVTIKIGLHEGRVIAVNANDKLDYFGTTVNVAARVQNESAGDDIVLTEALYESAGVASAVGRLGWPVETFQVVLKGLSNHYVLKRIRIPGATHAQA